MAKRFSEIEKWKDEWFCSLIPIEKLVWLFLIDNCDNAGFFELNTRLNSFIIGITQDEYLGAIKGLNRGLIVAKNGNKYWIKNFLFHQKNLPLKVENNAHKQIVGLIQQNAIDFDFNFDFLREKTLNSGANEGLISPIGKGIDKGKGLLEENPKKNISNKITIGESEYEMLPSEFMRQNEDQMNYVHSQMETYLKGVDLIEVFKKLDEVYNHTKFESENHMKFSFRTQGKWLKKKVEKEDTKKESKTIRQSSMGLDAN